MEKLFPDCFLKIQNWAYLWFNNLKFYTVCFYCIPSWRLSKNIEIDADHLRHIKLLKTRRGLELVSLPHFLHNFWGKNFFCYILFLTNFNCLIDFTSRDIIRQHVYSNCLLAMLWRVSFEINLIFLIKRFLLHNKNVKAKI